MMIEEDDWLRNSEAKKTDSQDSVVLQAPSKRHALFQHKASTIAESKVLASPCLKDESKLWAIAPSKVVWL